MYGKHRKCQIWLGSLKEGDREVAEVDDGLPIELELLSITKIVLRRGRYLHSSFELPEGDAFYVFLRDYYEVGVLIWIVGW